ncbi:hypothetical protein AYL99_09864 [Fonsecaea erecta]|uniref:MARVEL domain-containing protein n=1 Tax=Fonsecaea erecta TaxID=1367422 RepID=A0A178Z7N1_9EURO|nr:hypothetical protein AYL99_09864 [Fonsecaea erecta]OAP55712.1 hypothetical protein AYL99_09864 [Fonsecaea erecta]
MDPRQSSYEPFRHAQDNYEADKQIDASADDETLLKREKDSRQLGSSSLPGRDAGGFGKKRAPHARFQPARTVLRILSLVLAISVLGIQAYSVYIWLKTREQRTQNTKTRIQTRIWAFLDPWPTWVMLGAAVVAIVTHLTAFGSLCGCCASARKGASHVWAVYVSSTIMLLVWIAAVIQFKIVDNMGSKKTKWDIWSWTCYKHSTKDGAVAWNALCVENNYTFFAGIAILVLEGLGVILFIISQRGVKMNMPRVKVGTPSGYRRF